MCQKENALIKFTKSIMNIPLMVGVIRIPMQWLLQHRFFTVKEITANLFDLSQRDLLFRFTGLDLSRLKARTGRFCNGTLFWTMILTMYFVMNSTKKSNAICLLPMLLTWGTFMIATPVAFSLRYMLAFVYALPLFCYMIWEACSKNNAELRLQEVIKTQN